jgi:hypothetical protein
VAIGPTIDVRRDDPQLSADHRLALTFLRGRIGGSTVESLADASGLPDTVARECLNALRRQGLVCCETERVLWGYGTRLAELWKLSLTDRCLDVLATLPRPAAVPAPAPKRIPPQFWSLFSSGTHPAELSLPADAVVAAGQMIDSEDTAARAWALTNLPLSALRTLRTMRGYDGEPTASRIDVALAADDVLYATLRGVQVQVFSAPQRGDIPGFVRNLRPATPIAGLPVASLADLLASKLDVILYRPKLRDYIDLKAIDDTSPYCLEDGLLFHMHRYGTRSSSRDLARIVDLLADPGHLQEDRVFDGQRDATLTYLRTRVPDLHNHLQHLRATHPDPPVERSTHRTPLGPLPPERPDMDSPPRARPDLNS